MCVCFVLVVCFVLFIVIVSLSYYPFFNYYYKYTIVVIKCIYHVDVDELVMNK